MAVPVGGGNSPGFQRICLDRLEALSLLFPISLLAQAGDLAVGYCLSSSSVKPSVAFAGGYPPTRIARCRLRPTGVTGARIETGPYCRWDDYSATQVDPVSMP
jgi:hypothetical protein